MHACQCTQSAVRFWYTEIDQYNMQLPSDLELSVNRSLPGGLFGPTSIGTQSNHSQFPDLGLKLGQRRVNRTECKFKVGGSVVLDSVAHQHSLQL